MLYGLEDFTGASAIAIDGNLGEVCNVLFDDQSWQIRYLMVDVGSWLSRRHMPISTHVLDQPDWTGNTVRVQLTKEQVCNSPDIDATLPVSQQQEIAMKEYFGWPAYWEASGFAEIARHPPRWDGDSRHIGKAIRICVALKRCRAMPFGRKMAHWAVWKRSSPIRPVGTSPT